LTLQRQARELGRLRAGTFEAPNGGRGRPTRSKTWILTSHQRDYLAAAADEWGGEVHEWTPQGSTTSAWRLITDSDAVDAILPPGDPLSQHYEMWSRGGCQRRCDGETEQLAAKPCFCLAEFGEEFHLEPPEKACRPHTRLSVILPNIPDLGVWRMESKGFYAANEIAASIDLIRQATGGTVMVPIRLRIEPRKRVAQGKTKQYPVIVVEIRGATAGQILSGSAPVAALASGTNGSLPAIEAPSPERLTPEKVLGFVALCLNVEQVRQLWNDAKRDDALTPEVEVALKARAEEVSPVRPVSAPPAPAVVDAPLPAPSPVEGEVEPNPDRVFSDIMLAAPDDWGTSGLQERIQAFLGKPSTAANGFELQRFLDALNAKQVS
jgi:hypothetical protein